MIKDKLVKNLVNLLGWRTNRKIIVFESDDWGSIRMRSKKDYDFFLKKGYNVDHCHYNKYDCLESNIDLICLFETLTKFKDKNNNSPIFTINNIVANPDFSKIKESNYQRYYYEIFINTLKRYPDHDSVYSLYKEGIKKGLIKPQFHGREHLNVNRWMKALQDKEEKSMTSFKKEMFTVAQSGSINGRDNYLDTFGSIAENDLKGYKESLVSGSSIFRDLWGFESKSFIAPTYVWSSQIEQYLSKLKIEYIQGTHLQRTPKLKHENGEGKKYHYLGQINQYDQIYMVRNAYFEPASNPNYDWVNSCLYDIDLSFKYNKPAIIATHRVNYIGGIVSNNRDDNLKLLEKLLKKIVIKYPQVEFMSTDSLGNLISIKKNNVQQK